MRLRATTDFTTALYAYQRINAGGSTLTTQRDTTQGQFRIGSFGSTRRNSMELTLFNPFQAVQTSFVSLSQSSNTLISSEYVNGILDNSTSFDGLTIFPSSGNINITAMSIYGFKDS